jgi:hypothetical protein
VGAAWHRRRTEACHGALLRRVVLRRRASSPRGEHDEDGEDNEMNNATPSTCPSLNSCSTSQVACAARNTTLSPATARHMVAHACGASLRAVYVRQRGGGSMFRPRVHSDVYDVSIHRSIAREPRGRRGPDRVCVPGRSDDIVRLIFYST